MAPANVAKPQKLAVMQALAGQPCFVQTLQSTSTTPLLQDLAHLMFGHLLDLCISQMPLRYLIHALTLIAAMVHTG